MGRPFPEPAMAVLAVGLFAALGSVHAAGTDAATMTNVYQAARCAVFNSQRMFDHAFDATVTSEQLNTIIQKALTGDTPLPVSVDALTIEHRKDHARFRARLAGLPDPIRSQIEPQLDALIEKKEVGAKWNKATRDFLTATEEELAKEGNLKLVKETDEVQIVALEDMDRPFHHDIHLKAIGLKIDKKNELITGARLYLSQARDLILTIEYDFLEVEGEDTPLPVWSHVRVEQNSWMGKVFGFLGWPNKVEVNYSNYTFPKDGEETATPEMATDILDEEIAPAPSQPAE